MRERLRFETEVQDLDFKVALAKNARAAGKWKNPADPFDQGQAKLIDQMFAESPLISLFLKGAVDKKVTVAGNLQVSNHKEYLKHFAQHLQDLGKWDSDTEEQSNKSGGFTDKKRGKIYLHDYHDRGCVKIENAFHEGIHLIAHPVGAAKAAFNTFRGHYRGKFDEGVTQYFTERPLSEQGFKSSKTGTYASELEPVED